MKIRYDWVSDKVWPYIRDKEGYKKYCDSERALALCYWMSGEGSPDSSLVHDLLSMMAEAVATGSTSATRGDILIFHVRADEIEIVHPFSGDGFTYTHQEFRDEIAKWRQAWRKCRS